MESNFDLDEAFDQQFGTVEEFDTLTGQETEISLERKQNAATEKAQEDSEKLVSLEKHPGWILVKNCLEKTIAKEMNDMLFASHPDTMRDYQSRVKARKDLLGWLELKILEGRSLLEEKTKSPS